MLTFLATDNLSYSRDMIFNGWDYYLLFLVPSAILFRLSGQRVRPWVIFFSGSLFFTYFSYTQLGGLVGAACLGIFCGSVS